MCPKTNENQMAQKLKDGFVFAKMFLGGLDEVLLTC
jgi:hypothetical protein